MPKKDSFTFSDKLKKSKSLPLSKRIPSRMGGNPNQKRTLLQRAQRDLPFILVAGLALLLLPFLTKSGEEGPSGVNYDNFGPSAEDNGSGFPSGDSDLVPATFADPLKNIVVPRSGEDPTPVRQDVYTPNSNQGNNDNDYNRRNRNDDDDYNNRKSNIDRYKEKTKPSIREAVVRNPTKLNNLRNSSTIKSAGGDKVTYTLPGDTQDKSTSTSTPRQGVRPVALQPMDGKGVIGRPVTGENLYAEAMRALGSMNTGAPAKTNLLASQMRDVDGTTTPFGPGAGGPGAGSGDARPGAGGGPNNSSSYELPQPWWWDIMKTRNQKMWELMYYTPREMIMKSLYNTALQFGNCLLTGNPKGDINTFFGKRGGAPDGVCLKNGVDVMGISSNDWVDRYSNNTTSGAGDNKESTSNSSAAIDSWIKQCKDQGGEPKWSSGKNSGPLKHRIECLGAELDWFNWSSRYTGDCSGVNNDPMQYHTTITKATNGRVRKHKPERTVIMLLAKRKDESTGKPTGQDFAVYMQRGATLDSEAATKVRDEIISSNKCAISKLVSFTTSWWVQNKNETDKDIEKYEKGIKTSEDFTDDNGRVIKAYDYCIGKGDLNKDRITFNEIQNQSKQELKEGFDGDINGIFKKSVQVCDIWPHKIKLESRFINETLCDDGPSPSYIKGINSEVKFTLIVSGIKKQNVFAVLVEDIPGQTTARVMDVHKFNIHPEEVTDLGNGQRKYTYIATGAVRGLNPDQEGMNKGSVSAGSQKPKENVDATDQSRGASNANNLKLFKGKGKVIWIITDSSDINDEIGRFIDQKQSYNVLASDFVSGAATVETACKYAWCPEIGECKGAKDPATSYCTYNGSIYPSTPITKQNNNGTISAYYLRTSTEEVNPGNNEEIAQIAKQHQCTPFAIYTENRNTANDPNNKKNKIVELTTYPTDDVETIEPKERTTAIESLVKDGGATFEPVKMFDQPGKTSLVATYGGKWGILPWYGDETSVQYCQENGQKYLAKEIKDGILVKIDENGSDLTKEDKDLKQCTKIALLGQCAEEDGEKPQGSIVIIPDNVTLPNTDSEKGTCEAPYKEESCTITPLLRVDELDGELKEKIGTPLLPVISPTPEEQAEEQEEVIAKACNLFANFGFETAAIYPNKLSANTEYINMLNDCVEAMKASGKKEHILYALGYASKEGDKNCPTNELQHSDGSRPKIANTSDANYNFEGKNHLSTKCNYALSADRLKVSLDTILKYLQKQDKYADIKVVLDAITMNKVGSVDTFVGFHNTSWKEPNDRKAPLDNNFRYSGEIRRTYGDGNDFTITIVPIACGSSKSDPGSDKGNLEKNVAFYYGENLGNDQLCTDIRTKIMNPKECSDGVCKM